MKKYFLAALILLIAATAGNTAVFAQQRVYITGGTTDAAPGGAGGAGTGTAAPATPTTINVNTNTITPCGNNCNLGYTPLEPIPGITPTNGTYDLTSSTGFANLINAIFKIMISIGALIAVVSLTVGGVQYMVSGSAALKGKAIERVKASLWGIVLIAGIWLILNTINPNLLKFNFNPCPVNSSTCASINYSVTNTMTSAAPTQTIQVSSDTAKQLGLINNSVVLYDNSNATQANATIAQNMNSCATQQGFAEKVSGTAVGGNSNQSAEVCQKANYTQGMTDALAQ